ncbi:hypothetical protein WK96_10845 [Burkholderia cepacia]|nr:hypothetical protein WK96_10845 [Burkholderia cepacia]KVW57002.1 hypothetical protein WK97_15880 [Burkholderia cepacia]
MMLHPRAQHAIERGKSIAQPNRSPFGHFPENDFLLENITTSRDGPPVNRGGFTFKYGSSRRDNARIQSRYEMNGMCERETGKEVRPVFTDRQAGSRGILAHDCSG